MCFSSTADFTAAAVLAPVGLLTLRAAKQREQIPIASIPLFFAAHQFVEGFVWLGTTGRVSAGVESVAIYLYLAMAQMVLPIAVPLAIALVEPERRRAFWMVASAVGGAIVAARFGAILLTEGARAYPSAHTMVYKTPTDMGPMFGVLYVNATVLTTLYASGRSLRRFGIANVIGISIASLVRWEAVTSVWCVYAALVSGLIVLHLHDLNRGGRPPSSPSGRTPSASDGTPLAA